MVNVDKLLQKISESGFTEEKLAEQLEMSSEKFKEKLENHGISFTIREANVLVQILKLEGTEAEKIFFTQLSQKCD